MKWEVSGESLLNAFAQMHENVKHTMNTILFSTFVTNKQFWAAKLQKNSQIRKFLLLFWLFFFFL